MKSRAKDKSKYAAWIDPHEVKPYEKNAKIHDKKQVKNIVNSIRRFGWQQDVVITSDKVLVIGHGRRLAALELGCEMPYHMIDKTADELTDADIRELRIADNQTNAETGLDFDILNGEILDLDFEGFDFDFGQPQEKEEAEDETEIIPLTEQFIVPPFSVLDTRQGYWTERKRQWLGIVGDTTEGRAADLNLTVDAEKYSYMGGKKKNGTSVFDPVVCEIVYKWFCTDGGLVYDCFAGGAVRGIVAHKLGYKYIGIDLRPEQVEENKKHAERVGLAPVWYCDDSLNADKYVEDEAVDLCFTCPPYADLEKYSDDERDISNMDYDQFCRVYSKILSIACRKLKNDRFFVVVVGDVRDKAGAYRRLVDFTRGVLAANGLQLYNDLVLVEPIGTAAIRAPGQFKQWRKVVKTHQNILVFYKGNMQAIKENFHEIEVADIE